MIQFGPLRPDGPPLTGGLRVANNVLPRGQSYGPLRGLSSVSEALPSSVQGAFAARGARIATVAGTAQHLYLLEGIHWREVGGPYSQANEDGWSFAQFGRLILAANGAIQPQKLDLQGGEGFVPLEGNPPAARFISVVRDFVVLGNLTGANTTVQWSGLDQPEVWDPLLHAQADSQVLPDGGEVLGLVGGEYGVILQANAIRRMSYIGAPLVFQIDKVEDNRGVLAPGSIASFGPSKIFYLSNEGFYLTSGQGPSTALGSQKIDKTFFADLDQSKLHRISATVDAINKLYLVAYPGRSNIGGRPNRLAIFNFEIGEWTFGDLEVEFLLRHYGEGVTLEGFEALGYKSLDSIPVSLDSRLWQGGAVSLAAIDHNQRLSILSGDILPATIETVDMMPNPGRRTQVTGLRLHGDVSNALIALQTSECLDHPSILRASATPNENGFAALRGTGRYHRLRVSLPSGGSWSHLVGFEFDMANGGRR